jgi:hypothetical protein
LMDVILADGEVRVALDKVIGEASLPDGKFGGEAMGETSFDVVPDLREGFVVCEDEVDVVGHENVGVEEEVGAIAGECFEEEFNIARDLEDAAAVVADCRDEEGAFVGRSLRNCHWE